MHKAKRIPILPWVAENIMQVVDTIETEGSIGIARMTITARMHEVVVEGHIAHW